MDSSYILWNIGIAMVQSLSITVYFGINSSRWWLTNRKLLSLNCLTSVWAVLYTSLHIDNGPFYLPNVSNTLGSPSQHGLSLPLWYWLGGFMNSLQDFSVLIYVSRCEELISIVTVSQMLCYLKDACWMKVQYSNSPISLSITLGPKIHFSNKVYVGSYQ